jgi:uncharacterized membrane protein
VVPTRPPRTNGARRRGLDRRGLIAVVSAAGGFVLSWYLIHHGWFALDKQWDTVEYARYAHDILIRSLVPYRDFSVEYPPLALPVFVIPSMIAGRHFSGYMEIFELGMAICGGISVCLSAVILVAQKVGARRLLAGLGLLALSPLLLGPVILSRYDLFPTMLTIGAVAALYFGRDRTGFVLLALGTAAKAFPAVIVPVAFVYVLRNRGSRRAIGASALYVAVVLACFLPFLIVAPHGIWWAVHGQENRPLQIESTGAALFLAAHQLLGTHLTYYFTHNSDNLDGHVPLEFAALISALQVAAFLVVWVVFAAGPPTRERFLRAAAAAVCAFIVFSRVLSPQYLIWLVPLVAIVPGRRGVVAIAMLGCAMCMTQIWYPLHFEALKHFQPLESWAVVGRDLVLVALFGTLTLPEGPIRRVVSTAEPPAADAALRSLSEGERQPVAAGAEG